jgi:SPP1 gp7 family putative phage head morphogenesis protein
VRPALAQRRGRTIALIRARRAVMAQRPKSRPRVPRQVPPDAIRAAYFATLRGLLERGQALVQQRVVSQLQRLVGEAAAERGDASGDDAHRAVGAVVDQWMRELSPEKIRGIATQYASRTEKYQKQELARQMESTLGIDVFALPEKGLQGRIEQFTTENVSLIKSLAKDYLDDVELRVTAGLRDGSRAEEIAQDLQDRYGVAENRAKLIANDQIGKFYGNLNEARQTQLGVDSYVWRTVHDNRVRSEHADRDGKTFQWNEPPEDGHPGEAINCRCYADPNLDKLLKQLDEPPAEPEEPGVEPEPVVEPLERAPVVNPEEGPTLLPEEIAQAQAEIAATIAKSKTASVAPTAPAPDYFFAEGDHSASAMKARAELDAANRRMHQVSKAQITAAGPEAKRTLYDYTANSTRLNAWAGGSYDYTKDRDFITGAKTKDQIATDLAARMKKLDLAIPKTTIPETMYVYRAMELDSLAPNLPVGQYSSVDYTAQASAEKAKRLAAHVGQRFTDPVFASTSIDYNVAERFMKSSRVLLRIRVPKGAPGMFYDSDRDLTKFTGERELLLERRTRFDVVGVHQKVGANGATVTMLDVVYVGKETP